MIKQKFNVGDNVYVLQYSSAGPYLLTGVVMTIYLRAPFPKPGSSHYEWENAWSHSYDVALINWREECEDINDLEQTPYPVYCLKELHDSFSNPMPCSDIHLFSSFEEAKIYIADSSEKLKVSKK